MKHKETYEIMTEKLWCKVKTAFITRVYKVRNVSLKSLP